MVVVIECPRLIAFGSVGRGRELLSRLCFGRSGREVERRRALWTFALRRRRGPSDSFRAVAADASRDGSPPGGDRTFPANRRFALKCKQSCRSVNSSRLFRASRYYSSRTYSKTSAARGWRQT